MKRTWIALSSVVAGIVTALVWFTIDRPSDQRRVVKPVESEVNKAATANEQRSRNVVVAASGDDKPVSEGVSTAPPASTGVEQSRAASETSSVLKAVARLPLGTPEDLRRDFTAEPVDPSWAGAAEAEILQKLDTGTLEKNIAIANRDVQCRAETCRLLITYPAQNRAPTERSDLIRIVEPVSQLIAQNVAKESKLISGVFALHRGGFEGEPVTSEVFLARREFSQVLDFWATPKRTRPASPQSQQPPPSTVPGATRQ